ncbi:hypothetical protein CBM2633_A40167 [Cupriavidus taiwanensis]|nr:hypothetical protein CBM2610_A60090 [Cupriavidus taiwanensis]SPA13409.1 hypothetical protein CBM2633_A40167 [Cupriavidus taiwanensis]
MPGIDRHRATRRVPCLGVLWQGMKPAVRCASRRASQGTWIAAPRGRGVAPSAGPAVRPAAMNRAAPAGNKLFLCEHSRHGWRLRRPPEWGPDRQTIVNTRARACPSRHGRRMPAWRHL